MSELSAEERAAIEWAHYQFGMRDAGGVHDTVARIVAERTRAAVERAEAAEAKVARVEALLGQHWDWKAGRALYAAVRQALDADPAPSTGPLSDERDGRGFA